MLKKRLSDEEKSELYTKCVQLKMKAQDGKLRETDTLDTEGIFRLIESVPSPKAEPFKLWLAKLGHQKIDEVFDPSKGIDEMINFYYPFLTLISVVDILSITHFFLLLSF